METIYHETASKKCWLYGVIDTAKSDSKYIWKYFSKWIRGTDGLESQKEGSKSHDTVPSIRSLGGFDHERKFVKKSFNTDTFRKSLTLQYKKCFFIHVIFKKCEKYETGDF